MSFCSSAPHLSSGPSLESPSIQFQGSFDPQAFDDSRSTPLTKWDSINPGGFIPSRISRPNCVPTVEIFGHLPGYLFYSNPTLQQEESDDDDDDDDDYEDSPLQNRRGEKLRGSKPKSPRKSLTDRPNPRCKTSSLPPKGRMQCLWGGDCTAVKTFDYSMGAIKDWKNHIASHLAESSEVVGGSAGRVKCRWGECNKEVERGYLFKHITTHEVRFKLLCPRGCGVAIRGDNLERHLRVCQAQLDE